METSSHPSIPVLKLSPSFLYHPYIPSLEAFTCYNILRTEYIRWELHHTSPLIPFRFVYAIHESLSGGYGDKAPLHRTFGGKCGN